MNPDNPSLRGPSKCHLKTRHGWVKTIEQDVMGERIAMPFSVRTDWPESYSGGGTTYIRKDFELVSSVVITDHQSGNVIREYWFEEL